MNMRLSANLPRRVVALLSLLTMLIAPLCAPLCHSQNCASSEAKHSDDCHSSSPADQAEQSALASIHKCGSSELPSAVLTESAASSVRSDVYAYSRLVFATQDEPD